MTQGSKKETQDTVFGAEENIKNPEEAFSVVQGHGNPALCLEAMQFLARSAMADRNIGPRVIKELALFAESEGESMSLRKKALNEIKKIATWREEYMPVSVRTLASLARKEEIAPLLRRTSLKMIAEAAAQHPNPAQEVLEIFSFFASDKKTDPGLRRQAIAGLGHFPEKLPVQTIAAMLATDPDPSLNFLGRALAEQPPQSEAKSFSSLLNVARKAFSLLKPDYAAFAEPSGAFFQSVAGKINQVDARISTTLLKKMGLPAPNENEFLDGVGCQIIFLTRYGLTVKIMDEAQTEAFEEAADNDFVLQPLKYIRLSAGSFSVFPGIHTHAEINAGAAYAAGCFLNDEAEHTPVKFIDQQMENIGFLPIPWEIGGEESKFPVVLDHGCIVVKNEKPLTKVFQQALYHGIQERLYGDLRRRLASCWPENGFPDPAKMPSFLDECKKIVSLPATDPRRILTPGWAARPNGKAESAARYEHRLTVQSGDFTCAKNACTMP